jgi:hypothetical protein
MYPIFEYAKVSTPELFVPVEQNVGLTYTDGQVNLTLIADLWVNFTAKGSLSVNNIISVSAILVSNDTDFMAHYSCLGFTNSYNAKNKLQFSCLEFKPIQKTAYEAKGDLVWLVEGPSWTVVAPVGHLTVTKGMLNVGDPVVYISPISDTLAITSSENNERLTWVLVAFSFLSLQFLFEALFVRDTPDRTASASAQVKSEGFWHQNKLMRKLRRRQREASTLARTQPRQ